MSGLEGCDHPDCVETLDHYRCDAPGCCGNPRLRGMPRLRYAAMVWRINARVHWRYWVMRCRPWWSS